MSPAAAHGEVSIHDAGAQRMGFFTDTTVCIGCKACEVACKQWNDLPSDGSVRRKDSSYDNTGSLGATTWRHVRFVEQLAPSALQVDQARAALAQGNGGHVPRIAAAGTEGGVPAVSAAALADAGSGVSEQELPDLVAMAEAGASGAHGAQAPSGGAPRAGTGAHAGEVDVAAAIADMDRWIFMSDVCKHCTNAGCMDACPTGALIRTEFETVVLQADVCNGCGYCIPSCPFGVVARDPHDGRAAKCTLCYDRLQDGMEPACAKACPTDSIQFGPYDELVDVASRRVARLHEKGMDGAYLYGAGDAEGEELAGGLGAFFLFTEPPERYGLPAHADSPIQENVVPATVAAMGGGLLAAAGVAAAFIVTRERGHRFDAVAGAAVAGLSLVPDTARAVRRRRSGA